MIRTSDINPHQPTREVTAQRYQAAVQPAPQKVSGVEKLLDFGMSFAKQKHQWNKEVMEAEVSMATEDWKNAMDTIEPSEYMKDPDAATKPYIDKLYAATDNAPPGSQKLLRQKIDHMKATSDRTMKTAHTVQETTAAAVYNTSKELKDTGTLSDKNWDQVVALPPKQQAHALETVAQYAMSNGLPAIFDKALEDTRIAAEYHPQILAWQRQAQDRKDSKEREAVVEARRAQKAQAKEQKAQKKAFDIQGASTDLAGNMPFDYVLQKYPDISRDELSTAVAANPALHQQFLTIDTLPGDRALMDTTLSHPVSTDGVAPSASFQKGAPLFLQIINARGGDTSRLKGELSDDQWRRVDRAYRASKQQGGPSFEKALFTELTTTPNGGKYTDDAPARKALAAAGEGLTMAQQSALANEYDAHRSRGVSTAQALELAQETVTKGSSDFGGVTISDTNALKNNIGRALGTEPTDASVKTVAMATVDRYLAAASQAYFGTNQPLPQWQQLGGMNGALTFRHVSGKPFITIPADAFAKVAEEYQQNDAVFGMAPEQARVTNPEQFHMVGAGYPVGGAQ